MSTNSLKDRTAVVTGSGRGIGREIALLLGTRGANIVVSDIDSDNSSKTAEEFKRQGIEAISIPANVTSADDAEKLVTGTVDAFGSIDILVNNAGVTRDSLLVRMSEEDWDMVISINLKGAFLVTRSAARVMMKRRYGRIINIASVVGVVGNAGQANYSASKAGLIGLTKSTARELAGRG
ncbi:MAG: SDR family NAD(P)-dependent oxidoreductase, partial [candidate division Zixibacteria bacterium]|nr:SDR family NAD(P)-dependent oxidoreductase [candidate division Zixibacteria bacterium]